MNRQHLENVVGSLYYAIEYIDNIETRLKEAEEVIDYYATEENYNFAKDILAEARNYQEKYNEQTKDS